MKDGDKAVCVQCFKVAPIYFIDRRWRCIHCALQMKIGIRQDNEMIYSDILSTTQEPTRTERVLQWIRAMGQRRGRFDE